MYTEKITFDSIIGEHKMSERYLCIKCGGDFLPHQTIIEDQRKRCICLNCWEKIKRM